MAKRGFRPEDGLRLKTATDPDLSPWLTRPASHPPASDHALVRYLDDAAAIYAGLLAYRRFPEDLFFSAEGRVDSLREAIRRHQ